MNIVVDLLIMALWKELKRINMKGQDSHIFTGMQRDVSVSKQKAEFLYDGLNVRLTAREGDNMYSLTNELGTTEITTFKGVYLGHCVLGNYLVIFTRDCTIYPFSITGNTLTVKRDYIYRVCKSGDNYTTKILYNGDLGFSADAPIEAIGAYENENIQKVYWTDGINQPRVINIVKEQLNPNVTYDDTSFDFVQDLELKEEVRVHKEVSSSAIFAPGCIQYAITYFNKYGQESNIAYTTPLFYTCFQGRAGNPEEKVSNAFRIDISNIDTKFEYIRLYSIFRSSIDATPVARKVTDVALSNASGGGRKFIGSAESYSTYAMAHYTNPVFFISTDGGITTESLTSFTSAEYTVFGLTSEFYKFTKEEYPYLIISYFRYNADNKYERRYIIFGEADTLYISKDVISGPGVTTYKILTDSGGSPFTICTSAKYGATIAEISILDDGTIGEDIDPTSLLYIGGESITASTIAQKDGTLFLGNLSIARPAIPSSIKTSAKELEVNSAYRTFYCDSSMYGPYYKWGNTLNPVLEYSTEISDNYKVLTSPAGFKWRDHYRLGVQFQYKSGKWSEPVWIKDAIEENSPQATHYPFYIKCEVPTFNSEITGGTAEGCLDFETLRSLGYRRMRAVAVLPSAKDSLIVAQGLLCPTVYSVASRNQGIIHSQASWFTRPFPPLALVQNSWPSDFNTSSDNGQTIYSYDIVKSSGTMYQEVNNYSYANQGSYIQYHHGYSLFGFRDRGAEIQGVQPIFCGVKTSEIVSSVSKGIVIREDNNNADNGEVIKDANTLGNIFGVDQSFLTFHSPEIEFDDAIPNMDLSNIKVRRVGYISIESNLGDIDIQTSTPTIGPQSTGFIHRTTSSSKARSLAAGLFYNDYLVDDNGTWTDGKTKYEAYISEGYDYAYMVYPWNRTGSINNDVARDGRSAVLKNKKISNIKWSQTKYYVYPETLSAASSSVGYGTLASSEPQLFSSDEVSLVKIPSSSNSYNYYGNVDSILTPPARYGSVFSTGTYNATGSAVQTIRTADTKGTVSFIDDSNDFWFMQKYGSYYIYSGKWTGEESASGDKDATLRYNKSLIRMKYKTTPHIVLKLDSDMETLDVTSLSDCGHLYLAELYRDSSEETDFGGTSDEALKANMWIPVGTPIDIPESNTDSAVLEFNYGDTYYQRYDCLRVYPFTLEDENSITDIVSFMCETKVNIDGRYDRNRGNASNLYMTPTNFNLINPVYTQKNNFFTYRILDDDYYNLNKFPATITWSTQKTSASDVDNWTDITMASILDLDGSKGKITSLKTSNDAIYCFQERAISQILFNSRVQLQASDGVPIEISNNYKVDGSRYISEDIGCFNKWSICASPSGLYFIDSISSTLLLLANNGLQSISDTHGFGYWYDTIDKSEWMPVNSNRITVSPSVVSLGDYVGTKVFYDYNNKDLYTVTKDTALGLSELLSQFSSFYSYGGAEAMFNIGSSFYAIKGTTVWQLFNGDHNNIFGKTYPSSFTYVSNQDPEIDKTFTNIELRADFYDSADNLCTYNFFDTIQVWNEYQDTGEVSLTYKAATASNVKRKFRIWGINIPRDTKYKRDRIRNTWAKVKLGFTPTTNVEKFELHNISTVYYT